MGDGGSKESHHMGIRQRSIMMRVEGMAGIPAEQDASSDHEKLERLID